MLEEGKIKLSNGKTAEVRPVDGVKLHIDTSNIAFLRPVKDENYDIVSVSLEDNFTINKGDKIPIAVGDVTSIYEVVFIIIEDKDKSILVYSALPTKTTLFILPVLGRSAVYLKTTTYFVNAYLDETYQFIYLLYRFTGTNRYKLFEKTMISDPLCVSHIEHGPYHVVYKFKILKQFEKDAIAFMDGKYSKFSKVLKERMRKFYGPDESKYLMDIIHKNNNLKKNLEEHLEITLPENSELASRPDPKIEIYKPYESIRE